MSEDVYARKEGFPTKVVMLLLAGIVTVFWFIIGQGYFDMSPSEHPTTPTIWLVYENGVYSGIRESYCWGDKCVDVEFQEPMGMIDVTEGSLLELLMNSRIRPTVVNTRVFVIDTFDNPMQMGELLSEGNNMYKIDLQKGVYILHLQAIWQDLGDVNYAFKIRVN